MATSKPSRRKNGGSKTKSRQQLEKELADVVAQLQEMQDTVQECQQARDALKAQCQELEREQKQTANDLKSARTVLEQREQELAVCREELDDLKGQHEALIREKKQADIQIREQERQLQQVQNELKTAREQVVALEMKLARAGETPCEETAVESSPAGRTGFQIHIYPRPDGLHGQIVHLLSQARQHFRDLDADAILAFIQSHLPQETQEATETTTGAVLEADAEPAPSQTPPEPAEPVPESEQTETGAASAAPVLALGQLHVVLPESGRVSRVVSRTQAYRIELALKAQEPAAAGRYAIEVTIFARPLGGGPRIMIGRLQDVTQFEHEVQLALPGKALPPGLYKLAAALTVHKQANGHKQPAQSQYAEGSLLQVI